PLWPSSPLPNPSSKLSLRSTRSQPPRSSMSPTGSSLSRRSTTWSSTRRWSSWSLRRMPPPPSPPRPRGPRRPIAAAVSSHPPPCPSPPQSFRAKLRLTNSNPIEGCRQPVPSSSIAAPTCRLRPGAVCAHRGPTVAGGRWWHAPVSTGALQAHVPPGLRPRPPQGDRPCAGRALARPGGHVDDVLRRHPPHVLRRRQPVGRLPVAPLLLEGGPHASPASAPPAVGVWRRRGYCVMGANRARGPTGAAHGQRRGPRRHLGRTSRRPQGVAVAGRVALRPPVVSA